jgi:hypothetical protein
MVFQLRFKTVFLFVVFHISELSTFMNDKGIILSQFRLK